MGKVRLARTYTAEHDARLRDDIFDVDRGFFSLCSDVAARSYHDERVCLAVQIFDVESPEKDCGSGADAESSDCPISRAITGIIHKQKWGNL